MILVCHVILQDHVFRVKSPFEQELFTVNYHLAKFSVHRHPNSGDIVVLVFQVVSQNHLVKGSFDFMGKSSSR